MGAKAAININIQSLEEKLQTLKGTIPDEEFNDLNMQFAEIKKSGLDLSDDKYMGEIAELTQKISRLEFGKLSSKSIKETSKDIKLKSFLDKIEYIKLCIDQGKDVRDVLSTAYEYWNAIKGFYDEIEISEVERKIGEVAFEDILRRAKETKEVDISKINNNSNYYLIRDRLQLVLGREDINDETRLLVSSWLGECVDLETGRIDENAMKVILSDKRVWEVLAGTYGIKVNGEIKNENKTGETALVPGQESESRINAIRELSEKYGIPLEKLKAHHGKFKDAIYIKRKYFFGKPRYTLSCEKQELTGKKRGPRYKSSEIVAVIFNNEATEIGQGAHSRDTFLEDIVFPDRLEVIGEEAFYLCWSLGDISLPETVREIKNSAFRNTGLTNVKIPSNVKSIGRCAFASPHLKQLVLNDGLQEIGEQAFWGCALKEVEIPGSVRIIGKEAFCKNKLSRVIFNEGLEEIGEDAFAYNRLGDIELPKTVKVIEERTNIVTNESIDDDKPKSVREAIAHNPITSLEVLIALANDPEMSKKRPDKNRNVGQDR